MNKRRLIAISIAFIVTLAATAMWSASTIEREGDPDANVLADSGSETGSVDSKKKGGNKVVKVLTAPFKAFGKLFGGGKDRLQRMNEKDAEAAGCPNKVTPFNGEHNAGIQALSTRTFPADEGPLRNLEP